MENVINGRVTECLGVAGPLITNNTKREGWSEILDAVLKFGNPLSTAL